MMATPKMKLIARVKKARHRVRVSRESFGVSLDRAIDAARDFEDAWAKRFPPRLRMQRIAEAARRAHLAFDELERDTAELQRRLAKVRRAA